MAEIMCASLLMCGALLSDTACRQPCIAPDLACTAPLPVHTHGTKQLDAHTWRKAVVCNDPVLQATVCAQAQMHTRNERHVHKR